MYRFADCGSDSSSRSLKEEAKIQYKESVHEAREKSLHEVTAICCHSFHMLKWKISRRRPRRHDDHDTNSSNNIKDSKNDNDNDIKPNT
jgi:hypothetical protein